MLVIPLQPLPNQTLQVQVADQACTLNVYQQAYGLYVDVLLDGAVVIAGVIAENLNRIVRNAYLGLAGDFCFLDTQGSDDPIYTGLGTRWQLLYLAEADLP
jgi:hypothetical protein